MAALPYMQLYVADYLADTMHLTAEEHGAYLLVIMNYWQTGQAVPKNRLPSIAKISNGRWPQVEQTLSEYFTEDENGHWFHARIEADLAKVRSKSVKASKAGKASAAKRATAQPIDRQGKSNERSIGVELESNHIDTDTDTEALRISTNVDIGFDRFWTEYPIKKKKKEALKVWQSKKLHKKADEIVADVAKRKTSDRQWVEGFSPHPTTYLRGDLWTDEMEEVKVERPNFWSLAKSGGLSEWCTKYSISTRGKYDRELVPEIEAAWEEEHG